MLKSSMIAALSLVVFAAGAASAQSANMKIGVVNVAQLLQEAPQAKAVEDKLKDEFGPRQREITAMRQALQTQSETFQRDAPVMGEAERLNLERQIRDAQRDLQRAENEYVERAAQ
jgi:outer membrane protein